MLNGALLGGMTGRLTNKAILNIIVQRVNGEASFSATVCRKKSRLTDGVE